MKKLLIYLTIRKNEKILLFLATLIGAFGFFFIFNIKPPDSNIFIWYPSVIFILFWIIHFILSALCPESDQIILPIVFFLSNLGNIMIYRLNTPLALKQFTWMTLSITGFAVMLFLIRKKKNLLERYTYLWAVIGILLLIVTIIFGIEVNGAKLWLRLGPINIQPVEIVKFMLVLFLANYLSQHQRLLMARSTVPGWWRLNIRYFLPLLIIYGISLCILILQRDLGMAMLFFGIFLTMFYCATGRGDYCGAGIIIFFAGSVFCYYNFYHLQVRISSWLNPWIDMDVKGYQITQALMAVASGGMWGKGLGLGEPYWIPAVETDFIFSAIGEELGFMGSIAVIICYIILIERGIKISLSSVSPFKKNTDSRHNLRICPSDMGYFRRSIKAYSSYRYNLCPL